MKIWCTVTLKDYENLVYCNLAAILHFFFLSNNIQVQMTAWSDENYRRSKLDKKSCLSKHEQSLKSYNSIKIWCTVTLKQYGLYVLMI